jgi:hypothetical protein
MITSTTKGPKFQKQKINSNKKSPTRHFDTFNVVDLTSNSDFDEYNKNYENIKLQKKKQLKPIENFVADSTINDKQPPSIYFIKQKYKMYLDWLNETYTPIKSTPSPQQQQQKLSPNELINLKNINNNFFNTVAKPTSVDVNNLNWYKFETSVLNQENHQQTTPKNDYFSNITNKTGRLPQILKKPQLKPKSTSIMRKKSDFESQSFCNSITVDENIQQLSYKAVKFDSNLSEAPNKKRFVCKTVNTAAIVQPQPLKPILKSTDTKRLSVTQASSSPPSTAASMSANEHIFESNSRLMLSSRGTFNSKQQLPPLTDAIKQKQVPNCSEDFLAVINDMENDRLV